MADVNVALGSNGGAASASSTYSGGGNWRPSGAIDGDHARADYGQSWSDDDQYVFGDWLIVRFAGPQTINRIDLYSVQDDPYNGPEPTSTTTFNSFGLTDFEMQYWDGTTWVNVPGGNVTGNNLVLKRFTFSPITTDRIRVLVHASADGYAQVAELEAWATSSQTVNVSLGKPATQTSELGGYPASSAVDGYTYTFNHNLGDADAYLQVDLLSNYPLIRINVAPRQDCCDDRLHDFYVFVSDSPFASADLATTLADPAVTSYFYTGNPHYDTAGFDIARNGRYVRVQTNTSYILSVSELQVFAMAPPTTAVLLAAHHFDEPSWNGTAGEVIDFSGNGHHGTASGTPFPTADSTYPAIYNGVGTCGYAALNGPSNGGGVFDFSTLPVLTNPGRKTSVSFWMSWFGTDSESVAGFGNYNIYIYANQIGFNTNNSDLYSVDDTFLNNTGWHHVVAIFVNGDVAASELWFDGIKATLSQVINSPSNANGVVTPSFRLGGIVGQNTNHFTGALDELRIYNGALTPGQIAALYAETHVCGAVAAPDAFNAFESATEGGAINGVIRTKVAGAAFNVDVVALNVPGTGVLGSFTGDVKVELVDASDNSGAFAGSCRSSWVALSGNAPTTLTFAGGDAGRKSVSLSELDAWRDVRVRLSYPATGTPTSVGCSVDNFAIRPSSLLSLAARDGTSSTAGTARTLANDSATGGVIHKAGRPFTVSATAINAIAGTTGRYNNSPLAVLENCSGTACAAGWTTAANQYQSFTVTGTKLVRYGATPRWAYQSRSGNVGCNNIEFGDPWPGGSKHCEVSAFGTLAMSTTASAGSINTTATYNEAGSFGLQLLDTTFTAVDSADGSTFAEKTFSSSIIDVGRFVPDHFDVTSLASPVLKTFDSTLCGARSFTYVGQPFGYATAAQATVLARNAAGTTTANYTGALWKLGNASVTQSYAVTPTTPTLDVSAIGAATLTSNGDGTGLFVGNALDKIRFNRPASVPVAPFAANVALTWSVLDDVDTGVTGNGSIATTTPLVFSNIAFDAGNQMRFGVLRLTPAYGSELIDLPLLIEAQYWDGQRMATNTADSCTALPAGSIAMSNYQRNLAACETAVAGSLSLTGGRTFAKLLKPGNGNSGSVNLSLQLGAAPAGLTCTAVGVANPAAASANLPWLRGKWSGAAAFDQNPATRASFGQYRSPLIFQREMF